MERDDETQERPWADMAPDLLANIFARLHFEEIVSTVPLVCKPWLVASLDPLCYLSIDLRDGLLSSGFVEQFIVPRSRGQLRHIFVSYVVDTRSLYLLADSAPLLQTLHIRSHSLDDEWAVYAAPKMPHIVDLNLNLCNNELSYLAIEAFGKSCRHVLKLRRNRPSGQIKDISNAEASAIAQYYPSIKHLELQNNPLSEEGLKAILLCCPDLEHLDLAGCKHLWHMDRGLVDQCHARIKDFRGPRTREDDRPSDFPSYISYESCGDFSDPFFYYFGEYDAEHSGVYD